ncbi:MAG: mobile mystery protein A [Gemmatimonadaceae bacterium]
MRQLDSVLKAASDCRQIRPPASGWIRAIRDALGMSAEQLARRIRIKQPSLAELERSERTGTITLNSLRKAAQALDCDVVYLLVPRESLLQTLKQRINEVATARVRRVSHTMRLEDQQTPPESQRIQIEDLERQLLLDLPRDLWD